MNPAEQETRELSSNSKLDQVLDQYLNDLQQGRACSRAELLAKHPDLAVDLTECLDAIEFETTSARSNRTTVALVT